MKAINWNPNLWCNLHEWHNPYISLLSIPRFFRGNHPPFLSLQDPSVTTPMTPHVQTWVQAPKITERKQTKAREREERDRDLKSFFPPRNWAKTSSFPTRSRPPPLAQLCGEEAVSTLAETSAQGNSNEKERKSEYERVSESKRERERTIVEKIG